MSFLLDTDTCSEHLRGRSSVLQRTQQYSGRLHVSAISVGELYVFALRRRAPRRRLLVVEDFLASVTIVTADAATARQFGELHAQMLDQGQPMPVIDLWIAATALVRGLTLVTHNTKDFDSVPGLSLADWLSS